MQSLNFQRFFFGACALGTAEKQLCDYRCIRLCVHSCVSVSVCVCATCASCRQVLGPLSPSGSFQLSLLKTLHSQEPLKILRSFHVAHIRRDPFSAHVCVCVSPDVSVVSSPACKISEIPCSCLRPFLAGVSEVSTI